MVANTSLISSFRWNSSEFKVEGYTLFRMDLKRLLVVHELGSLAVH